MGLKRVLKRFTMPNENIAEAGKKTRFKPGQKTPGAGRPKGKTITTLLKEVLNREIDMEDPISKEKGTFTLQEIMLLKLALKASEGDRKAIKDICDRIEGTAIQRSDVTMDGELIIVPANPKPKKKTPKKPTKNAS